MKFRFRKSSFALSECLLASKEQNMTRIRKAMALTAEPVSISVEEAAEMLGISRAALYPLVTAGELPSFKLRGRRLILVSELRAWATRMAQEGIA